LRDNAQSIKHFGGTDVIRYKRRREYKYNLHSDVVHSTEIKVVKPEKETLHFLEIDGDGNLTIKKGYSWDGPSGPTIDTKSFMRGSLIHDALYQLMREGVVPQNERKRADEILREVCIEDGMSKIRAWWVYRGVRIGGAGSAKPDLLSAP
jgi:hypothetical protein